MMHDLIRKYEDDLGKYRFEVASFFPKTLYERMTDLRIERKEVVAEDAKARIRRSRLTTDGKLTVLAGDHPGRICINYGNDPVLMGNRYEYLGRILRVLLGSDIDGVMGTPDIIEELFMVSWFYRQKYGKSFLDNRIMIGTMNRGGLLGTVFEMNDRFTSYTAEKITELKLDGGKFMFRLEEHEADCGRTMYYCSKAIVEMNRWGLPVFFETLPVTKDSGGYTLRKDAESFIKTIGVVTAMGDSSINLWLKIPYCERYDLVAASTTCPILMLGGPSKGNPIPTLVEFEKGLRAAKNIRGVLAGRNIHFPGPDDPASVAQATHQIVHNRQTVEAVLALMKEHRGQNLGALAHLV
jgi:DhnA family fructose-bisphosphate aldolase class Ia